MAQPMACDICGAESGVQMLTDLQDGSTMVLGPQCMPSFYGHSVLAVMGAGEHSGTPTKCQACKTVHLKMTDPGAEVAAGTATEVQLEHAPADVDDVDAG